MSTSGNTRTTLISPFQYFADPTKTRPIFNGFIYIGKVDGDPTNPDDQIPVQVICECGGTPVNVTQPIRTGPGGLPIYNGQPAQIVVCQQNYSLTLQDKDRVQIYHSPNVRGFSLPANQPVTHNTLAEAIADDNSNRNYVLIGDTLKLYRKTTNAMPNIDGFTDAGGNVFDRVKQTPDIVNFGMLPLNKLIMYFGVMWSNDRTTGIQGITLSPDQRSCYVSQNVRGSSDTTFAPDETLNIARYVTRNDSMEVEPAEFTIGLTKTGHGQDLSVEEITGGSVVLYTSGTTPVGSTETVSILDLKGNSIDVTWPQAGRQMARISWRGSSTTDTNVDLFRLLPDFDSTNQDTYYYRITPSVSDDGQYIVGHAANMRGRNLQRVYVWEKSQVLSGNSNPLSQFNIPPEIGDGGGDFFSVQSIYMYGGLIYMGYGLNNPNAPRSLAVFTVDGSLISLTRFGIDTTGFSGTLTLLEPEGIHVSPIGFSGFDNTVYMGFNISSSSQQRYALVEFGNGEYSGFDDKRDDELSPATMHFSGNSIDITWNTGSFLFLGTWSESGVYTPVMDMGANTLTDYRTMVNYPNLTKMNFGTRESFIGTFSDTDRRALSLRTQGGIDNGAAITLYGDDDTSSDAGNTIIQTSSGTVLRVRSDRIDFNRLITPTNDNQIDIGTSSSRIRQVFAASSTINTSDEREKYIESIPDNWLDAAAHIHQIRFKWLNGGNRWHVGYGAQSVYQALIDAGVENPWEISFLCKDVVVDQEKKLPLVDEKSGQIIDRWSLRLEELSILKMAYIERKISQLL